MRSDKVIFTLAVQSVRSIGPTLGLVFVPPARQIQIILGDFMRISQDTFPYSFYASTKTAAFAASYASEIPMSTVRVVAKDGSKRYKKVGLSANSFDKMSVTWSVILHLSSTIISWY